MDMLIVLIGIMVGITVFVVAGLVIMVVQAKRIDRMYANQAKVDALRYILSLLAKAVMKKRAKGEDELSKAYEKALRAYNDNPSIGFSEIAAIFAGKGGYTDASLFSLLVNRANREIPEMTVEELIPEILKFDQASGIIPFGEFDEFKALLGIIKQAKFQGIISSATSKIKKIIES